jgi:hypothetical protein
MNTGLYHSDWQIRQLHSIISYEFLRNIIDTEVVV